MHPVSKMSRKSRANFIILLRFIISKGTNIEARDYEDWTPLHLACTQDITGIVNCLVSKGANIERQNDKNATPLHYA